MNITPQSQSAATSSFFGWNDNTAQVPFFGSSARAHTVSAPKPDTQLEPGDSLVTKNGSKFKIESLLGAGGMGVIYRARDLRTDHLVALKVSSHKDRGIEQDLFLSEVQTLSRLDHPNVPHLLQSGNTVSGTPYLVMELVPGRALGDILRTEKQLSLTRSLNICRQIASIMDYAHNRGIVHNDLKPSNILVADTEEGDIVYLLDFGISQTHGVEFTSNDDVALATINYMSPEQVFGQRTTAVSDVYQLGLIFFQCLMGELPFEGTAALEYRLYGDIVAGKFYDVLCFLPPIVELFILQTLQREPGRRTPSMLAVLNRLRSMADAIQPAF